MAQPEGLQIVWWWNPFAWGIHWFKPFPDGGKFKGQIYKWVAQIGPLEVRRWT